MTTRIPLADPAQLDEQQRAQYDRFPSNLTRALLLLDERLAGALPATANALRTSTLAAPIREAAILRVAALEASAYERFQHLGQARALGWTDEQIDAVEEGRFESLPTDAAAVLRFVDAVVHGPEVDDDTFAAARDAVGDRSLVTLIVLVGHYLTVSRLIGVLRVDLDDQPDGWTQEH